MSDILSLTTGVSRILCLCADVGIIEKMIDELRHDRVWLLRQARIEFIGESLDL